MFGHEKDLYDIILPCLKSQTLAQNIFDTEHGLLS